MRSVSEIPTLEFQPRLAHSSSRSRMSVVAIGDVNLLEDYVHAWEDLAATAIEANPFYEPWMLMPALRELAAGKDIRVVMVLDVSGEQPVLCGAFPLEKKASYKGLPIAVLSLWQHIYCALCTPLVREGYARECLDAFLNWLGLESGCSLMEFNLISGDGAFNRILSDCLFERATSSLLCESYSRALFRPAESAEEYLESAISPKHRREMRRVQRRLSELGRVEFDELEQEGEVDAWVEEFLELEASSWKGEQGSALGCVDANRNYFVTITREAFRRGRLMMTAMRLDGRPLAQRLSFVASRGAFAFKTAYDESYAGFSPGISLEIDTIRRLHASTEIDWMDSCATPIHFINRLWTDRRAISTVLISTGRKSGDLLVEIMPLMKRLNRGLKSIRQSAATKEREK